MERGGEALRMGGPMMACIIDTPALCDALAAALQRHPVTLKRDGETSRGRPAYRRDYIGQATAILFDPAFRSALAAAIRTEDEKHGMETR